MDFIKKSDIPADAEIENDMISSVGIRRDNGFILQLSVKFVSERQELFLGYNNTNNIGHMILALAKLLCVNPGGDSVDILEAFKGTPCRIASNALGGDIVSDTTWIGHFMKDRFALAKSVVLEGLDKGDYK